MERGPSPVQLLREEYQEMFPSWDWQHPKTGYPDDYITMGLNYANQGSSGNADVQFALAMRCRDANAIQIDTIVETRLLGYGLESATAGEKIMELEDNFDASRNKAINNTLSLARRQKSSDQWKNKSEDQIIAEASANFLQLQKDTLNHYCGIVDREEARMRHVIITYYPSDNLWHQFIAEAP